MTESTIVRGGILAYIVVASFALWLLWRNAAASDALKNTGILAATMLPILIAVLPYIIVKEKSYPYSFILFYDSKDKTLTTGSSWNSYQRLYLHMFTNLSGFPSAMVADNISDFAEKKGLDIIEKGIVEELMVRFTSNWDVVWRESRGPDYISYSGAKGTIEGSNKISLEQIKKDFSHNSLISAPGILVGSSFCIPPNSTLTTSQPDKSRMITITTRYGTVSIAVRFSYFGVAQQGIWGVFKADPQNPNRYYTIQYQVLLTIQPKRFNQYPPEMESYSRWHENIKDVLQRYDWEYVDKQIEQREMRGAIQKITKESVMSKNGR
jgi:hypothetical protein